MDAITGAVVGVAVAIAGGLAARALTIWSKLQASRIENELESAKLKSNWYNQMQMKKLEKKSKKKSGTKEDDEDNADDDDLVRALQHPLVRGFADELGIQVDELASGNRQEWAKVKELGERIRKNRALLTGAQVVRG